MWRPEGWQNPYEEFWRLGRPVRYSDYEAGADAMLEALLKNPYQCHRHDLEGWCEYHGCCCRVEGGVLVFIPKDEEPDKLENYGKTVIIPDEQP